MPTIVQINYRLNLKVSEFLKDAAPVAEALAKVQGLRWKIWLSNEETKEGGGLYLFEDDTAVQSFIDGPVVAKLRAHPAVESLSIKDFDISTQLSLITRAPI